MKKKKPMTKKKLTKTGMAYLKGRLDLIELFLSHLESTKSHLITERKRIEEIFK